jgi:hypothetical protein
MYENASLQLDLFGASLKTWRGTLAWDLTKFTVTYAHWVTRLRQDYSARQRSARLINGSDCSFWPTMNVPNRGVESRESKDKRNAGGIDLQSAVKVWPTPTEQDAKNNAGKSQFQRNTQPLNVAAGLLDPDNPNMNGKNPELYPTPGGGDARAAGRYKGKNPHLHLFVESENWATPEAQNQQGYQIMNGKQYPRLGTQVNWATPNAGDAIGTHGGGQGRSLRTDTHKMKGKLNPDWVEQLMGLQVGWTDLGYWVTE